MKNLKRYIKVAVVQFEPILFDKKACIDKIISLIEEASEKEPDLIVFPELSIPGYPLGLTFGYTVGKRGELGRQDWKRYYDNSICIGDEDFKKISDAVKKSKSYVSIGVSEKDLNTATLYNTNFIFSQEGELVSHHRKIKPTGSERLIWGDGDIGHFPTVDTKWGHIGCLICWETYMPLARMAMYEKGITIYISANTNDNPEWQSTIKHVAIEGHCYFINADLFIRKRSYPTDLSLKSELDKLDEVLCRGGSCIIDPYGHEVSEPLWDKEGIIYNTLDMDKVISSRMEFDVCGHYDRKDLFNFYYYDK